jgi:5,10-methylenetetrahydromethanopterin reductase
MLFGFAHIPSENYQKDVELVQLAEELGYDYAWIPDQTFHRDPYIIMSAIALATKRIQIGVGVTNPYTRHPAITARVIGTLDEIAPGRIHLGIGAGNRLELLIPLGIDIAHASVKCKEMVEIIRILLSGEWSDYHGKYFQSAGIRLDFKTNPKIPIYIAGRGPLVLQTAGEIADGVIVGGLCSLQGITYALNQITKGAKRNGRHLSEIQVVSWTTCFITPNRQMAVQVLKPVVAHIIGGAPMVVLQAVELPMETVEAIKASYAKNGTQEASKYVDEKCIDSFTIVGEVGECIRRIRLLEKAGVTQLSLLMPPGTMEQYKGKLVQFAEDIFPAFK